MHDLCFMEEGTLEGTLLMTDTTSVKNQGKNQIPTLPGEAGFLFKRFYYDLYSGEMKAFTPREGEPHKCF